MPKHIPAEEDLITDKKCPWCGIPIEPHAVFCSVVCENDSSRFLDDELWFDKVDQGNE